LLDQAGDPGTLSDPGLGLGTPVGLEPSHP
jgi:hypothetical protein